MVEMLGVLAVVGVLSVGGIAGYTYAMNKHYANELLMGASERAVLVTAQIASGRKPSLKEFANHTTAGGTFATEDESVRVYSDGIGIPVSGVKGAVCKNLIKDTEDTDIIIVDTNDAELTEDGCKEENTLIITFETGIGGAGGETDPACADVECPVAGTACINGSCLCPDGTLPCNGACCGEGEICTAPGSTSGECKELTCDEADEDCCVTNADCGKNEFCLLDSYTTSTDAGTTCPVLKNGVCTALTGDYAPQVVEDENEPLYGVTYNDAKMRWQSASNWCQANGSSLMTLATLNTLSGLSASAYNETDSETARKIALQGGLGKTDGYVSLEDANSSAICTALGVGLGTGHVISNNRLSLRFALCR